MSIEISQNAVTRRALLGGLTAVTAMAAVPAFASAPALMTGAGDFRKLSLFSDKTGEWLNTVYWIEGEYIPEAMAAVNHLMRDWREELIVTVSGELRIYTTTIPAGDRRVCLMQDPLYRLDVCIQAMGYTQCPMTTNCLSAESAFPNAE